jgi:hypothetical protein
VCHFSAVIMFFRASHAKARLALFSCSRVKTRSCAPWLFVWACDWLATIPARLLFGNISPLSPNHPSLPNHFCPQLVNVQVRCTPSPACQGYVTADRPQLRPPNPSCRFNPSAAGQVRFLKPIVCRRHVEIDAPPLYSQIFSCTSAPIASLCAYRLPTKTTTPASSLRTACILQRPYGFVPPPPLLNRREAGHTTALHALKLCGYKECGRPASNVLFHPPLPIPFPAPCIVRALAQGKDRGTSHHIRQSLYQINFPSLLCLGSSSRC